MASPREGRDPSPIRHALLKWQVNQDEQQVATTQQRLMRVLAPPAFERLRPDRPCIVSPHDTKKGERKAGLNALEEKDASLEKEHVSKLDKWCHLEKLQSVRAKAVATTSVRPTGQKGKPSSTFDARQAGSCPSRRVGQKLSPQALSQNQTRVENPIFATSLTKEVAREQMKTPERWRRMAMQVNEEAMDCSQWEEEDARQVERILEKAAKDGELDTCWQDVMDSTRDFQIQGEQGANAMEEKQQSIRCLHTDKETDVFELNSLGNESSGGIVDRGLDIIHRIKPDFVVRGMDVVHQIKPDFRLEHSRWRWLFVLACLGLGVGGFFVEQGLDSIRCLFIHASSRSVPREAQDRMRARVRNLHAIVANFQLLLVKIEKQAETMLMDLHQSSQGMQRSRKEYQANLVLEMQEVRQAILRQAHEEAGRNRVWVQEYLENLGRRKHATSCKDEKRNETLQQHRGVDSLLQTSDKGADRILSSSHEMKDKQEDEGDWIIDQDINEIDGFFTPSVQATTPSLLTARPSFTRRFLLLGLIVLVACVVFRGYNLSRRKKWFALRQKRRKRRQAQQRARKLALDQDECKDREDYETDSSVEEVYLMTSEHENEEDAG